MSVGSRIKQAREKLKITQEELGERCGTTKQSIFKYENGVVTNIPFDRLERIAEVLEVSPAYLMGWDEDAPAAPKPPEPDSPQIDNPDIRMIARAGKKMSPEQAADLRKFAEYMYPEAFKDDE